MDIGIDLGTTYSVTAVKGEVTLTDSAGETLRSGVTVIPSPLAENRFPSVVWIDPDDATQVLVGSEALQKAQEGGNPILFSKRGIGTDELLTCGPHTVSAKWVATQILKHMKACAERSLGQVVERAVITHPAYFTPNQIEETRQAAIDAGFDMALPEQMLMEPAAAALAFLQGDTREALTVLAYDLGGGTFDVTILERKQGLTTLKAFDGNRLLGGYNFDKRLADWIVRKIEATGRKIAHDPDNPDDRGRYARLLLLAENVKIQLSQQFTDKVPVQIRMQNILLDTAGRQIMFTDRMTRAEFKALIAADLDETVQRCRSALARASMTAADLDLILLVGGSTYGPWVDETLAAAFEGVPIERLDPDLDVAAGAAIRAATLPPRSAGSHGVRVLLDVPRETPLDTIHVRGTLSADDGSRLGAALRARLRVLLQTRTGATLAPVTPDEDGGFLFADIELEFEAPTELKLTVVDEQGLKRCETAFTVRHGGGLDDNVYPTLPRELSILTADGHLPIADEGADLPARIEVELTRLHADAVLTIPVFMEDLEVGSVRITDLPTDRGEAGSVRLALEVTTHGEIRGDATVLTNRGETIGTRRVRIAFPPMVIPPLADMRARYEELESLRAQDATESPDSVRRLQLSGAGQLASEELLRLFSGLQPDRQEVFAKLRDFARLVQPRKDDMTPTKASFLGRADFCRQRIHALGHDPAAHKFGSQLDEIVRSGETIHASRNRRRWSQVNQTLELLLSRLPIEGNGKPQPKWPTALLKVTFRNDLDKHRMLLAVERSQYGRHPDYEGVFRARYDKLGQEIDRLLAAIQAVDDNLDPDQGLAKLLLANRGEETLALRIRRVPFDIEGKDGSGSV